MQEIAVSIFALFVLIASLFDLKSGEVPDWVSLGFIGFSLLVAGLDSVTSSDAGLFLNSLLVGAGYFAFGYVSFRLGQWGGGDVKILAGIGCSVGYLGAAGFFGEGILPYYLAYFINMGVVAWPYVMVYSAVLGAMRPESFTRFISMLRGKGMVVLVLASFLPSLAALFLDMGVLGVVYLALPLLVLLSAYLKAVEEVALQKTIRVDELKESDALAEDLVVGGRLIGKRRDIEGVTSEQVVEIKKLAGEGRIPEEIRIRWGIKFVPILFIAFVSLLLVGDMLEIVFRWLF